MPARASGRSSIHALGVAGKSAAGWGLGSMTRVPRLMDLAAEDDAARLELYINTIRRTARVFEVGNCKTETAVEYDCYMGWINTWLCLSGFGSFVTVDDQV